MLYTFIYNVDAGYEDLNSGCIVQTKVKDTKYKYFTKWKWSQMKDICNIIIIIIFYIKSRASFCCGFMMIPLSIYL